MIGVLIPDYRTPELSWKIRNTIRKYSSGFVVDLIVAQGWNNPLSEDGVLYTTDRLEMTGAINLGLSYFDVLENLNNYRFFAYWIVSTSMEFGDFDYLTPMVEFMQSHPDCVMTSPTISETAWDCLWQQNTGGPRKVWGVDNIATLIRADWFNSIGRYDPALTIGWGSALETCYIARKQNKSIYVFDNLPAKKLDGIAHTIGSREETREERNTLGSKEMHKVLGAKYGNDFLQKLGWDYRK